MVAVGIWAAQLKGRVLWGVPLAFVSAMALGGALGMMGIAVTFVEQGIILSVLLLGVFVAAAVKLPPAAEHCDCRCLCSISWQRSRPRDAGDGFKPVVST